LPDLFAERAATPTSLSVHGPSPQSYDPWPQADGLQVVQYPSAGRMLRGLVARPASATLVRGGKRPALVYLHGGFALGTSDIDDCAPFLDAGFVVFAPALRGENGNPGDYELAFGELDDARAALAFAGTLDGVDASRIVVFGHSAGGMLSSMLALYADLPALDTGSAGGLYGADLFDALERPFVDSPRERRLRLFAPHAAQLRHPHFACRGERDRPTQQITDQVTRMTSALGLPFETKIVPGNHFESLGPCMTAYLSRVLAKL
jgi:hypothetical protein